MKVFRENKAVKDVPKKFAPIVDSFTVLTSKMRLSPQERENLNVALTKHKICEHFKNDTSRQGEYAYSIAKWKIEIESITEVNKRDGSKVYDIDFGSDTMKIRVGYNVICDYPSRLFKKQNEF